MKKYYTQLMETVKAHSGRIDAGQNKVDDIKQQFDSGIIGQTKADSLRSAAESAMMQEYENFRQSVFTLRDAGKEYARGKYGVHGDALTKDAELFINSGIHFTSVELQQYADQYKDNPTMLRVISEYASRNNLQPIEGIKSDLAIIDEWENACNRAIVTGSYNRGTSGALGVFEYYLQQKIDNLPDNDD